MLKYAKGYRFVFCFIVIAGMIMFFNGYSIWQIFKNVLFCLASVALYIFLEWKFSKRAP